MVFVNCLLFFYSDILCYIKIVFITELLIFTKMLTQAISLKIVDSIITKRFKDDSTHKCDFLNFILEKSLNNF